MGIVTSTRIVEWPSPWRWVQPNPKFLHAVTSSSRQGRQNSDAYGIEHSATASYEKQGSRWKKFERYETCLFLKELSKALVRWQKLVGGRYFVLTVLFFVNLVRKPLRKMCG